MLGIHKHWHVLSSYGLIQLLIFFERNNCLTQIPERELDFSKNRYSRKEL